jgi:hypothetical protein
MQKIGKNLNNEIFSMFFNNINNMNQIEDKVDKNIFNKIFSELYSEIYDEVYTTNQLINSEIYETI